MNGARFLDVANALSPNTGEEWQRTRIGRMYYGVYLEYRQFAEDRLGFSRLHLAREHTVIANLLKTLDNAASDDLKLLRIDRNQADYDLELLPEDISQLVTTAEILTTALMARLAELRAAPDSISPE